MFILHKVQITSPTASFEVLQVDGGAGDLCHVTGVTLTDLTSQTASFEVLQVDGGAGDLCDVTGVTPRELT